MLRVASEKSHYTCNDCEDAQRKYIHIANMIVTHTPAEIGERIRAARRRRKLTQAEAAELVDLPKRTYESYERGELESPSWEKVRQISEALGVDLETGASRDEPELFGREKQTSNHSDLFKEPPVTADDETALDIGRRILQASARQIIYGPSGEVLMESVLMWYPIRGERIEVATYFDMPNAEVSDRVGHASVKDK